MSLRVRREARPQAHLLRLEGKLTMGEGEAALRQAVSESLEEGASGVILHLGEVSYMDSSGVGEVIYTLNRLRKIGGVLKLCVLTPRVDELMAITRLKDVLDIYPDEEAALASCQQPA